MIKRSVLRMDKTLRYGNKYHVQSNVWALMMKDKQSVN
jgi:hypothetical protein